ncbi:hypothetical protein DFQ29_001483 [Apophysomyces sp. BC1021]|nr:hypothetical protein DFQ29_001483 [Apophysomyces sp. BC1021]
MVLMMPWRQHGNFQSLVNTLMYFGILLAKLARTLTQSLTNFTNNTFGSIQMFSLKGSRSFTYSTTRTTADVLVSAEGSDYDDAADSFSCTDSIDDFSAFGTPEQSHSLIQQLDH